MRTFNLVRHKDVTGVSGEGVVAEGAQFSDGAVALRWCVPGKPTGTTCWDSILHAIEIHGHDGATEVRWHDYRPT